MDDAEYTFVVDYAEDKDALKAGELASGRHLVTVRAPSCVAAQRIALEMVFARGREPTKSTLVDVRV